MYSCGRHDNHPEVGAEKADSVQWLEGCSRACDRRMVSRQGTTGVLDLWHAFKGVMRELGRTKWSPCEAESWGNWPLGKLPALRW